MADFKEVGKIRWLGGILFAFAIALFWIFLVTMKPELEFKTYDLRMQHQKPVDPDSLDIVIVGIDKTTFAELPDLKWPFPRKFYAFAMENLFRAGAEIVAINIQFTEPMDDSSDIILAATTKRYADRIIHSGKLYYSRDWQTGQRRTELFEPFPRLKESGAHLGLYNIIEDRDGVVRSQVIQLKYYDSNYFTLPVEAFLLHEKLNGRDIAVPASASPLDEIRKSYEGFGVKSLLEGFETFLIHYRGPDGTFPYYSLSTVLDDSTMQLRLKDTDFMEWLMMDENERNQRLHQLESDSTTADLARKIQEHIDSNPFRGKIVFIGAIADVFQDTRYTPYSLRRNMTRPEQMSSTEIYANACQTLIDKSFIRKIPVWAGVLILVILVLLTFFLVNYTPLWSGLAVPILLALAYWGFASYQFTHSGIWLPIATPLGALGSVYLIFWIRWLILLYRHNKKLRLENELIELKLKNASYQAELDAARRLQLSILPTGQVKKGPFDLSFTHRPAEHVGGDYYDYQSLDDNRLLVVIGDVAGHGLPASILASMAKSAFIALQRQFPIDATSLIETLNDVVRSTAQKRGTFMTFCYLLLDPQRGILGCSANGHPFPLIAHNNGTAEEVRAVGGLPLGVRPHMTLNLIEAPLKPGDIILLYTDGLPEQLNAEGEPWGYDAMRKKFSDLVQDGGNVIGELLKATLAYGEGMEQGDDMTLVSIKYSP